MSLFRVSLFTTPQFQHMMVRWSRSRRLRPHHLHHQLPVLSQLVGLGFVCIQLSLSGSVFLLAIRPILTLFYLFYANVLKLYQVKFQAASALYHIRQKSGVWTVTAIKF